MSRNRKRHTPYGQRRRDTPEIANRRLHSFNYETPRQFFDSLDKNYTTSYWNRVRSTLNLAEDRRQFHPEGPKRPAKDIFGRPYHQLRPVDRNRPRSRKAQNKVFRHPGAVTSFRVGDVPDRVGFLDPDRVAICIRRKVRREVLHALGIPRGMGGRGGGKPRFNWFSKVAC